MPSKRNRSPNRRPVLKAGLGSRMTAEQAALLRRLARMRTWTAPARLPRALLRPDAVAVSHNPLLCAVAANAGRAVGFRHAETMLDAARRRAGPVSASSGDAAATTG